MVHLQRLLFTHRMLNVYATSGELETPVGTAPQGIKINLCTTEIHALMLLDTTEVWMLAKQMLVVL